MKKIYCAFLVVMSITTLHSQTFNSPESVEYDNANSRWIVGQNGSGALHVYSPASGTLTPFTSTVLSSGPHGIEIMGDTLYACDGASIKGFDLTTGIQVVNMNLGASFLNGLTSDGVKYLFATDFTSKRIYRVCPSAGTFNIMCTTTYTPNGIIYDGANNRCVFVNWGANARVQAMSLADSSVSTLYSTTTSNIDGITRDAAGYWYITTWGGTALRRFDPAFSASPVSVMTGLSNPADIDINAAGDSIGIPNSGNANNVVFYTNITTTVEEPSLVETKVFPVPSTGDVNVNFASPVNNVNAELYDMSGKLLSTEKYSGTQYIVQRNGLSAGNYIIVFRTDDGVVMSRNEIIFE
ncbi:MAG: T9SS type A sorting domain-containing protein [Bacteroidia bacterium]|nr:T9SS type A sorting domain-containing protein [Bacteroidia bacterium]